MNATEDRDQWTAEGLTFLVLYCCSSAVGTVANILVIVALLVQNLKSKNLLVLNLCASDLLVCTVSMPVSVSVAFAQISTMGALFCKAAFFFQSLPVAASTTSLMMLALDRYATVKRSRILSRFRPHKMILAVWIGAAFVTSPVLYAREVMMQACKEFWPSDQIRTAFNLSYIAVVYLIPCLTVASCHFSVGHKLCASSQASLPLPIPLMRKSEHVLVVASVLPNGPSKVQRQGTGHSSKGKPPPFSCRQPCEGSERELPLQEAMQSEAPLRTKRQLLPGRQSRTTAERTELKGRKTRKGKPPLVRQVSRQSLHSRRRLANMLVAMVIVFAVCWGPYVVLKICSEAGLAVSEPVLPFCLLLGHAHSAINPVVYYLSNRQSLSFHWSCCKTPATAFRRPPTSSTNEAALGAFHPRYTARRFQPRDVYIDDYL